MDDFDDGYEPLRDPEVERAFIRLTDDIGKADNPYARLLAIKNCATTLEPLGDPDAIDELRGYGHLVGVSDDCMSDIVDRGLEDAHLKRSQKPHVNGYGQGPEGLRQEWEDPQPQAEEAENLIFSLPEFLEGFVPPDYVIDGLLVRGYLYSLTAMTGAGKTAIGLLIAELGSNRTRRRKLGTRDVEHVRVLYIACENATDVRMRLIGMEAALGFNRSDLDMLVIDKVFDLEKNLDRIRKEVEALGGNIGIVIIDTSAAMFQGEEENSNTQALAHAKTQRKLCELPGKPCVVSLNHPPKSVATPQQLLPRGGGAYLNEVDGNFTAWAHDDRMTTFHWTGKLRGPDFDPIEFRMRTVNSTNLVDSKGRLIPTVVAEAASQEQVEETEQKSIFQEKRLLNAMGANPGASLTELAETCGWLLNGEVGKPNKSLVQRVMGRLKTQRLVDTEGRTYALTSAGKKVTASRNDTGNTNRYEEP